MAKHENSAQSKRRAELGAITDANELYKTNEYRAFLEWYVTPLSERDDDAKTQKQLAQKLGVGENAITDWKHRSAFIQERSDLLIAKLREKTPNVIDSLYARILKEGTAQEVMAWLKFVEKLSEKHTITVPESTAKEKSDIKDALKKLNIFN